MRDGIVDSDENRTPGRKDDPRIYRDLAKRFFAAFESHRLGLNSVDYTLRKYVRKEIPTFWLELAKDIDRAYRDHLDRFGEDIAAGLHK